MSDPISVSDELKAQDKDKDPYEINIFEPGLISFSRSQGGVFQGVIEGKVYEELILFRIFPFQYNTQYISVRNSKSEEIGVIRDIDQLDEESRGKWTKNCSCDTFFPL